MANACLVSGGKDSMLALHRAVCLGIEINLILTFRSKNKESYMFHYPNIDTTRLQAEALGIRQVFVETEGKKEEELKDLERALVENDVRLLVTGATFSVYQAERIRKIADKLKIELLSPLWHVEPLDELNELARDFEVIVVAVSAEGFDESFLGSRIDRQMIERLIRLNRRYKINMLFEGGEAESFVLDAPLFKKKITVNKARREWNGVSGTYIIEDAELVGK